MTATREIPPLTDQLGRPIGDLRISVTDRCNFRCSYCMPKSVFGPGFQFLPKHQVLSFEEISRIASVFVHLGVGKLRLTGGEPLLRSNLAELVRQLVPLGADVAITTNGSLLPQFARQLASAGLKRVTVSLDALDDAVFRRLNDVNFPVSTVLSGIDAAASAGLSVKVNCVIRKGFNETEIVKLASYFRGTGHILRFIEFMDVGITNGWKLDQVLGSQEVIALIDSEFPLERTMANYAGEVAERYVYQDGAGEIGVVSSVTAPFCGSCSRARISAEGQLYTCLFATTGTDLRAPLRAGASDAELAEQIAARWRARLDHYSELRSSRTRSLPKIEMSYIGG